MRTMSDGAGYVFEAAVNVSELERLRSRVRFSMNPRWREP